VTPLCGSDSTSHKHIEYESRAIALKVIDYSSGDQHAAWTLRTLGIGTSVNHSSQTQVNGLKDRLNQLAVVFNDSPLAKRENLRFIPDDFAYKLIGTSGDHAADQKKSHEILRVWKMDVIMLRLGEEAVYHMGAERVMTFLIPRKASQIEEAGGREAWDKLSEAEKVCADTEIIKALGKLVFDGLPKTEQDQLTLFIRTGCCMHKDLNAVKGGDKAMQKMWKTLNKTPPIILANKDNAAVLAASNRSDPSPMERRAEEISKRGGSHATALGGMICRHKDKKKGQQDTYSWFMETTVGHPVPYPDVCNTRYGTHGQAAGTIIAYHEHFVSFMEFIRDSKDKIGLTNIELNFLKAITNKETLTELCALALYNILISRPFMQYVRLHENLLDLGPFFQQKVKLLESISQNPMLWIGTEFSYETCSLRGSEVDEWAKKVVNTVHGLASDLPDLEDAVAAFVTGAMNTFTERFNDEFRDGGDIDKLTDFERDLLYFPSCNDINEGGLGSWRIEQRRWPAGTLHKFRAAYTSAQNNTESFIKHKLTKEEDMQYLRRVARERDGGGTQRVLKEEQMKADKGKMRENRQKEASRQELSDRRAAKITETGKSLILLESDVDSLLVDELNRQLDYHREVERKLEAEKKLKIPMDASDATEKPETVPKKTHMKTKPRRVAELKKAIARYHARETPSTSILESSMEDSEMVVQEQGEDVFYESDFHDDLA
jgi:hypothetical protein